MVLALWMLVFLAVGSIVSIGLLLFADWFVEWLARKLYR